MSFLSRYVPRVVIKGNVSYVFVVASYQMCTKPPLKLTKITYVPRLAQMHHRDIIIQFYVHEELVHINSDWG